ncbi:glucose 1-dehydrogenase [Streptomyces sp. NPDC047070]|uniref:SDR family NAD(P)-dependent oxidoreductase n=1 Tax=Streptomyces sp. NPDC047070 TaxID=3154923 RepID=UPI003452ADE2
MTENGMRGTDMMSRFSLAGRVAVVTGASSGLGIAHAVAMAQAGADVAVGARRVDGLRETVERIRATGRDAVAVRTDVTAAEDCDALVDAAMSRFGRVDILVNNAGTGGGYHPATEDPPENFLSTVDVNLNGSYWMAQACGRVMRPGSSVINISSVMAVTTARMPAAGYSAAKAAVLGLTRDLAAQWGPLGIRVNAILPGVFPSEQTAHYSENYRRKLIAARIPLGRIGDPEDVAAVAVFLAGDASAYLTGVSLPVDGGVLLL